MPHNGFSSASSSDIEMSSNLDDEQYEGPGEGRAEPQKYVTFVLDGYSGSTSGRVYVLNVEEALKAGVMWEKHTDERIFSTLNDRNSQTRNVCFEDSNGTSTEMQVEAQTVSYDSDGTSTPLESIMDSGSIIFPGNQTERNMNTPVPSRFVGGRRKRQYTYRNRKRASPREKSNLRQRRMEMANSTTNPFEIPRECCKRLACFVNVNRIHAFHWFRELMAMDREHYKASLISWYSTVRRTFEFDGRRVCWNFLREGFGFSNDLLCSVSSTDNAKAAQTSFAQPRENRNRTLQNSIITFLRMCARSFGDDMPHRNFTNLPFGSRNQVFQRYIEYFNLHDPLRFTRSPPTVAHFYQVWSRYVSDVKVLKNTGFEKCGECVFYNEERAKNLLNPAALRKLNEASRQHYHDMARERQGYELRKQLSSTDPQHYLSLVVDGADQSHYGLPHFLQKSKEDRGHKIAVKLVGVLVHGVEKDLYLFSMVEGFETGANHIIESIHRSLDMKKNKLGKLPPVLFVQVDNCTRENKNRFFLGYLEILVAMGVFVEVQMSSLEVGHTHTDVDQSFSCVHRRLDRNAAFSLPQLHEQIKNSYLPPPHVEELDRIGNFSAQCLRSGELTKVSNYTQYRYFKLLRDSNEGKSGFYQTKCYVKRHLWDDWIPLPGGSGRGFLKTPPDVLSFPKTKTKVPTNFREVNACLRAAETRVRDERVIAELYSLRDRVYTEREYDSHWKPDCFELNGDYTPQAERRDLPSPSIGELAFEGQTEMAFDKLKYDIGDFVAIKPEEIYNTPFWIAEVMGYSQIDDEGYPYMLTVRWYTAGHGTDPLTVTYSPGFDGDTPWVAEVHVDTVMLRFDSLTKRRRLKKETVTKISRGLV